MGISNLCNSGSKAIRLCGCYGETDSAASLCNIRLNKFTWKVLWIKFKKEKEKIFVPSSASVQLPYDEYTYSQNFDRGFAWDEPDYLSRSFSVRFAGLSREFQKKRVMY